MNPKQLQLLAQNIRKRAEMGKARYTVYLTASNGRIALVDTIQEALDKIIYLRQALEDGLPPPIPADYATRVEPAPIHRPDKTPVFILVEQDLEWLAGMTTDDERSGLWNSRLGNIYLKAIELACELQELIEELKKEELPIILFCSTEGTTRPNEATTRAVQKALEETIYAKTWASPLSKRESVASLPLKPSHSISAIVEKLVASCRVAYCQETDTLFLRAFICEEFYQLKAKLRSIGKFRPHDETTLNPRVSWVQLSERTIAHDIDDKKIQWTTPEHEDLYQAYLAGRLKEATVEIMPKLYAKYCKPI